MGNTHFFSRLLCTNIRNVPYDWLYTCWNRLWCILSILKLRVPIQKFFLTLLLQVNLDAGSQFVARTKPGKRRVKIETQRVIIGMCLFLLYEDTLCTWRRGIFPNQLFTRRLISKYHWWIRREQGKGMTCIPHVMRIVLAVSTNWCWIDLGSETRLFFTPPSSLLSLKSSSSFHNATQSNRVC